MLNTCKSGLLACASLLALAAQMLTPAACAAPPALGANDDNTKTPIKHVIVIYGENRSFDHLFATYVSPSGDNVLNLLSEKIIKCAGISQRRRSAAICDHRRRCGCRLRRAAARPAIADNRRNRAVKRLS